MRHGELLIPGRCTQTIRPITAYDLMGVRRVKTRRSKADGAGGGVAAYPTDVIATEVHRLSRFAAQSYSPLSSIFWLAARFNSETIKVRRLPPAASVTSAALRFFSLSLPQTFFSQATGGKRIVANVCRGRRDVLANLFLREIGSIGHGFSLNYRAIDLALRLSQVRLGTDKSHRDAWRPAQNASSKS